jgi:iron complex transport system permease protein
MENRRGGTVTLVCGALLLLAALFSLGLGAVHLDLSAVWQGLSAGDTTAAGRIIWHVRLPRLLAAVLCGAGLAASGVIIQTVLANPLASPGILGVNAGAGLTVALWLVLVPGSFVLLPLAAFVGALITVLTVCGVARRAGLSRVTLILSGVAVSSLLTAGINTITTLAPDSLIGMRAFQLGGFAGVSLRALPSAGAVILCGILAALALASELDILGLGEETARSLGLHVQRYRYIFLILAAALAGAAVSFAGLISFVGLIVPHIARRFVSGSAALLSVSALGGAVFLILCDTAARTLFAPFELPVGILISFLGVPFVLWLLSRERRGRRA